jgi:short subunit dehydrogenase-like uncharacterized protein
MSSHSSTESWMIYGANGYTGRLAARVAKSLDLNPILAGRNAAQIAPLARELGFASRIFSLADPAVVAKNLDGVAAVLHCAGPFSATSKPMLAGCVRAKTHYLDITGEIAVFEDVHSRSDEFRRAGIVVMPGVGFDVVPSDCLAAMLKRELPLATHLKLAFKSRYGKLSPGTTKTMVEGLPEGGKIRKDGRIVKVPAAWKVETIAFTAEAPATAVTIPWGDVSTAFYSTGIPNIEVFLGASEAQIKQLKMPGLARWLIGLKPVQAFIKAQIAKRVTGPNDAERARDEMYLYGEASDPAGNKVVLRMRTPEGYSLTAESAVTAILRVLEGRLPAGAYTPSMAFGADFVLGLTGVKLSR